VAKITQLPSVAALTGNEMLPMLQGNAMVRATPAQVAELMNADSRPRTLASAARNHVLFPRNATYFNGGVNQTGAVKIGLPVGIDPREITLRILVRDHYGHLTFHIGGRNDGAWNYQTARVEGQHRILAEHPVSFGNDGTRDCIWIGNTSYAYWDNLTVMVLEATLTGLVITEKWMDDWFVGLTTTIENIYVGPIATHLAVTTQHIKIDTARVSQSIGMGAGSGTGPAGYNVTNGPFAGGKLTTGFNNTLDGMEAGASLTTGSANFAGGTQALQYATTAVQNTAINIHALMSLIDGIGNTAIAPGAMEYLLHGNYNTALSPYSLRDVQGDGNVAIGNRSGMLWKGSDRLFIATNENEELIGGDFKARWVKVNGALTSEGVQPANDNAYSLGGPGNRYSVVYAASPEISTSDKRQKTEIGDISDLLLDAWGDVCWSRFKFTDGRRWHFGLIAQDVYAALKKRGIDPFDLAPVCRDEWAEETGPTMKEVEVEKSYEKIVLDPNGNREDTTTLPQIGNDGELVLKPVTVRYRVEIEKKTVTQLEDTGVSQVTRPAGDLWGLRYVECLAIEAAWQRREIARMRQRGDALEARLLALEKAA